ncbi:hypothetical protein EPI10_024815 [Gossypium australe]|uniref:Uncharacterized protein n=1 Tax=Gossypium australe TaxID=47621 RepID=A0A5B6VZ04_9ROSI|nr:hypothetical protein EPI10_024815 [Gossypium australe]
MERHISTSATTTNKERDYNVVCEYFATPYYDKVVGRATRNFNDIVLSRKMVEKYYKRVGKLKNIKHPSLRESRDPKQENKISKQ